MLVIRGVFSKLSLCIYGEVVEEGGSKLWGVNAMVAEAGLVTEV
jgi:hypothetical protein